MTVESPQTIVKILGLVVKFIQSVRRNKITYRDLVSDIIEEKPQDDRICKCSVMKKVNRNKEIELAVLYLDKNNQPILQSLDGQKSYGFLLTAKEIDEELYSIFNKKDCIIFQ